jgi:hypothetical protein
MGSGGIEKRVFLSSHVPVQCIVVQKKIKERGCLLRSQTCSIEALVSSSAHPARRPVHNVLTTERESFIAHEAIVRGSSDDSKDGGSLLLLSNHLTDTNMVRAPAPTPTYQGGVKRIDFIS